MTMTPDRAADLFAGVPDVGWKFLETLEFEGGPMDTFVSTGPVGETAAEKTAVLMVVPHIPEDAEPRFVEALTIRREATFLGYCSRCGRDGASQEIRGADAVGVQHVSMNIHNDYCPATDKLIAKLVRRYQRGRRSKP